MAPTPGMVIRRRITASVLARERICLSNTAICSRSACHAASSGSTIARRVPLPAAALRTRGANRPEAPRAITSPKVFMSPRMTLAVACRWLMRCGTGNQQHPQRLCIHALHCNFAEPARTDDLRQPPSVVGIGLVDLQLEGGLGLPGVETNYRQPQFAQS